MTNPARPDDATEEIVGARGAPQSFLERSTLFSVIALQLMVVIDAGLRWEHGFAFLRPIWIRDEGLALCLSIVVFWLLVRKRRGGWLAAAVGFPLFCILFVAASAGTVSFYWRDAPLFSIFKPSWFGPMADGGLRVAATAATACSLMCSSYRHSMQSDIAASNARGRLLVGFGLAWLLAASLRFTDLVTEFHHGRIDDPAVVELVSFARSVLWAPAFIAGASLLTMGLRERRNGPAGSRPRV